MPKLYPYQQALKEQVYERWRAGDKTVALILSTSGGKSVILSDIVREFAEAGKTILVMAHTREIVGQLSLHLGRQKVRHRLISPTSVIRDVTSDHRKELEGQSFINPSSKVACAGMQTLVSRMDELAPWLKTVDLLVADEFHHVTKGSGWGKVFEACVNAISLGVTATPQRADGKGLGRHSDGYADCMLLGPNMRSLIDIGSLTEYEILAPPNDFDLSLLKQGADGDYTVPSMKAAAERSHLTGDIVEHYIKHSMDKAAIVFATDVETSIKISAQFNAAGIASAAVSAKTDPAVRSDVLRRLKDGRLKVVTQCNLYGEGVSVDGVQTVILARPSNSLAFYMQAVGRALRTDKNNPDKVALIIDHCSNVKRHGFPDTPRPWTLDRREKRGPREKDVELLDVTVCPNTGRPMEIIHIANCIHCGENHTKPTGEGITRAIEIIAGDLTKLSAADLAALRAATILPSPDDAAARGMFAGGPAAAAGQRNQALARIQAQRELQDAIAEWAGHGRHVRNRDDSELHRRFYHATGVDVLTALAGSRAEMVELTRRVQGWVTND